MTQPYTHSQDAKATLASTEPSHEASAVKILVVDDLTEKLLVYRTVLEEPGLEIITARSGGAALKQVLQHDFAVILLDINMPDMDGFEAASLIRGRKQSAHTPIIFITAFADELHAIKSYSYGAVDYILSPIVPEVLRTKVRVFVDLFRKTREVQRQAEVLREVQAREHQRQLWETNERLRMALEAGRMGACEWDLGERLLSWSPMIETIFGFQPGEFNGSAEALQQRLHPQDREHVVQTLTQAVQSGRDFRVEHRILTPGAGVTWVELRGQVFIDEDGKPHRLAGVCMDITERKKIESQLADYRNQLERTISERTAELESTYKKLRLADRLASIGTLAAGLGHDMGNLLLPVRMRLEALQRMPLEPEAAADVKQIEIATEYMKRLSQGLRLFALDPDDNNATSENTTLHSWWLEVEPFFRNALPRHVALRVADHNRDQQVFRGSLRDGLPTAEANANGIAPNVWRDLQPIAIPSHRFTQCVYNLVQNAGQAMRQQESGEVCISARLSEDRETIIFTVADTGPGMTEQVARRCMDPFFTTKTRSISTGLGLALVRAGILRSNGKIEIDTAPGRGTRFHLHVPVAEGDEAAASAIQIQPATAIVSLKNARLRAYVASVLRSRNIEVLQGASASIGSAGLCVLDAERFDGEVVAMLEADAHRRAIVLGEGSVANSDHDRVFGLPQDASPSQLRDAIFNAIHARIKEKVAI